MKTENATFYLELSTYQLSSFGAHSLEGFISTLTNRVFKTPIKNIRITFVGPRNKNISAYTLVEFSKSVFNLKKNGINLEIEDKTKDI